MRSNSRSTAWWLILFAVPAALELLQAATVAGGPHRPASTPAHAAWPSPPIAPVPAIVTAFGGAGDAPRALHRIGRAPLVFLAQTKQADTNAAETPGETPQERTPEEKKRIKSAVVLLSVLSGIALSGLLMIIAAIAIRGLQRKLAGPTQLDREPADLFPQTSAAPDDEADPATRAPSDDDSAAQETRLT